MSVTPESLQKLVKQHELDTEKWKLQRTMDIMRAVHEALVKAATNGGTSYDLKWLRVPLGEGDSVSTQDFVEITGQLRKCGFVVEQLVVSWKECENSRLAQ